MFCLISLIDKNPNFDSHLLFFVILKNHFQIEILWSLYAVFNQVHLITKWILISESNPISRVFHVLQMLISEIIEKVL